jgi:hypothetical protein
VVDKEALGQVSSKFPLPTIPLIAPQLFTIHHPGLVHYAK